MAYSCPYSSSRPRRRRRRRGPRGSGPKRGRFLRLSTVASHGQERERRSREELKCVAQRARLVLDNSAWCQWALVPNLLMGKTASKSYLTDAP